METNLNGVDLKGAYLSGVDLRGHEAGIGAVSLKGARLCNIKSSWILKNNDCEKN
jgi:uncharacterized protein YjbI with pentapeptide repeats